jgi:3-oxoacyl-[acyl-carrier protein] reductase
MKLIKNKVAVITGAARGIGASCASAFAQEGASCVFICDIDFERAKSTALSVAAINGCECIPIKVDVTDEKEVRTVFEIVMERCGRLDVLVNSAGICRIVSIDDLDMKSWDLTMNINLKGAFLLSREALRIMREQRSGTIINIASQAGKIGGLTAGADYSSSKAGLLCLTKTFAKNAAPYGITVNSVAPGLINTEMTTTFGYDPETIPLKRVGTSEEVADVVLFLASHLSRYVTGACVDVNGGMTMW